MRKNIARYLKLLRARHRRDRSELRAAMRGQRPGVLMALLERQRAVERETARILRSVR